MSGRTKQIIYNVVSGIGLLLALAGTVLLACFGPEETRSGPYTAGIINCFLFCIIFLPLPAALHELGHAAGGLLCGMRVVALSFGFYRLDWSSRFRVSLRLRREANGATGLLPKRVKGARGKLIFALYAGAALDFIYAAVILAVYFAVTGHPAMQFFALFAPLCIYEGVMALYPAEASAGPTDGKFAIGLIKKTADAEVALRVMTAQGLLYTQTYGELPRALLFDAPVVREDSRAYLALLQLQWRTLFCAGEDGEKPLSRLGALIGYVPEEDRDEVLAEIFCGNAAMGKNGDTGTETAELPCGGGVCGLVAQYAAERTEENRARALAAAEKVKMRGEREFYERLIEKIGRA